jgi:hypothetical protein
MSGVWAGGDARVVSRFMLHHRHESRECGVVFASFKAFESPLRNRATVGSCDFGDHQIWWDVSAATEAEALGYLPPYVSDRATAMRVSDVEIP